jgi:ABC-2 type transport system ATP-binding protein
LSAAALAIREASKAYGRLVALDRLSLDVAPGEFVALLGPNGAGKSTLFRIVCGLVKPDSGRVEVAGVVLRRAPARALARLGVVFQEPTLDLERSVEGNLRFHADLHGVAGAGPRIAEELRRFGLAEVARRPARTLSGGNRRKVELARALLHRPAVLLLDEPTAGLDPASRGDLLAHVQALARQGAAVLWATHLVEEAEGADRVMVLDRGATLALDSPAALRRRAEAPTLAEAFIGLTRHAA